MKRIAVVIRTTEQTRVREALRAAVGLSLRGDRVVVRGSASAEDPAVARAIATLRQLGHDVNLNGTLDGVREADAVEVWT